MSFIQSSVWSAFFSFELTSFLRTPNFETLDHDDLDSFSVLMRSPPCPGGHCRVFDGVTSSIFFDTVELR